MHVEEVLRVVRVPLQTVISFEQDAEALTPRSSGYETREFELRDENPAALHYYET